MPRIKTLTLAMSAVAMMTGCASSQPPVGDNRLKMEPVQTVTHGQNNPQAFYQLGRYYHGQTRYDLALESYRQALSLQPQYVDALTGMGVVHATLGQYDEALRVLRAAASLDPGSVTAQNNLGYIHWLRNERDEAIRAYRQALKLDPWNMSARDNLRLAMKDAVNAPIEVATSRPSASIPEASGAGSSTVVMQEVQPQVYELHAPALKTEAMAQSAVPARLFQSGKQSVSTRINPAPVAVAPGKPGALSGLALNEIAPGVHELSVPVQKTKVVAPLPEHSTPTAAVRMPVQAASARPAAPAAADSAAYLEVMNGNGVNGIANKVSHYLAARGYPSASTGNNTHFNVTRTRIEYRPGHAEQARHLSRLLPGKVVLSKVAALDGNAKIRLVLGNDFRHEPSAWNSVGKANTPADTPVGASSSVKSLPLVVANGNGVKGMARKVAQYLSERGYRTTSVYDLRPFNKAVTRIEYRKGYASQAIKLGDLLPRKVAYVESDGLSSDVRLVLGHDIKHNMAAWSPWLEAIKLAEATAAARF
jgi:tetratricopeptide (TPR) repeat protein